MEHAKEYNIEHARMILSESVALNPLKISLNNLVTLMVALTILSHS